MSLHDLPGAPADAPHQPATQREREAIARESFTWLMAHALGGALQPIIGALELLADESCAPLTSEQRRYVADASAGAERLRQMQDDILLLARARAGTLQPYRQCVALTTVLREAIAEAQQPRPPEPARAIRSNVSAKLPPLHCDDVLLRRALAALIENALRFSPPDAPIAVEARCQRGKAVIRVHDGGPGVAPEDAERIFAPLIVGERPFQTVGVGLGVGLGLAVARAVAEAHGGDLTLERSDAPGATFTLKLPLTDAQPPDHPSA